MPAPPAPPMPEMPPMPEAPPAPPEMPPMPEAPPAPPEMPPMPEAPPAPPEMPPMPEAPPAPPEMPPMPEAPPAPPEMPPMPEAPPAPPEMPPMPEAPPGLDLLTPVESTEEVVEAPAAPPGLDLLAPLPTPEEPAQQEPAAPALGMDLLAPVSAPEEPAADEPAPVDPLLAPVVESHDPLMAGGENAVQVGEIAGATIRSSVEVDEVPGDKLEGTLHEIETATLSSDGSVVKQKIQGTLTVNNPSAEDRIYDIDVLLDNADSTDIGGDQISVDELEAGKNYVKKYSVSDARMLILREALDTNPARDNERSLSIALSDEAGIVALSLEVENVSSVQLNNINVTREIPDCLTFTHSGVASIEGGMLTWEVGTLSPGEKQVLSIEGEIMATSTSTTKAGVAKQLTRRIQHSRILPSVTLMRSAVDLPTCESEKTSAQTTGFVKLFSKTDHPLLLIL